MLQRSTTFRRHGMAMIECAIVYPLTFLLILGLIIGGLGIFRYQQVAHLARDVARYAAVRGGQYQTETGQAAITERALRDFVVSQSAALDTASATLGVQVFLNATSTDSSGNTTVTTVPWDSSQKAPYTVVSDSGKVRQNTVSVTISYQWLPEAFLVGPIRLTSTATMPMQY